MKRTYCIVAVNTPFNNSILSYCEGASSGSLARGMIVTVPLGASRLANGCIIRASLSFDQLSDNLNPNKIKDIYDVPETSLSVSDHDLNFYSWVAKYYHYPLGMHIFDCIPKASKRLKLPVSYKGENCKQEIEINDVQSNIVSKITEKINSGFSKWLVHGVTGSGKTLVYFNLIQKSLEDGNSVLFLLPEINLTPQFIEFFKKHLDVEIYTYNSSIRPSDKYALWSLLQVNDCPKLIVGVRSSIFLPIKKLGLIVVDEEHDQSFKQDDRCPYNARDIAIKKANMLNIPIVLGSATPCLETFYSFYEGQFKSNYMKMEKRVGKSKLPDIELLDTREGQELSFDNNIWPLDKRAIDEIALALEKKEQVLVFVNRLGYANFYQCKACGHQFNCPNCSTNLKFYKERNEISCQYCSYKSPPPEICPECQNMSLFQRGFGTEKVKEVLQEYFTDKIVDRFDRDEIKNMKQLEKKLNEFHSGHINILVGTQMLSKGHNFKNVNLVLILGIDSGLNFPDFRANERVFQLLTQVSGRSGRFGKDSKVLIQTLNSENSVFKFVKNHSFDEFQKEELEIRKICDCPPVTKVAILYFSSRFKQKLVEDINKSRNFLETVKLQHFKSIDILGPRPLSIEKRVNKFTWCIMLKSTSVNELHNIISTLEKNMNIHNSISLKIDIDPFYIN